MRVQPENDDVKIMAPNSGIADPFTKFVRNGISDFVRF